MHSKNPLQLPRVDEIRAGRKFWGYLDTEIMQGRYALAAHFLRGVPHVIEIGGYRDNVITNHLAGPHESVTVYSLDAEFDEREAGTLNGRPCAVRHVRDFFQSHEHPASGLGLVALGLEIIGDVDPLCRLLERAAVSVIEIASEHPPSRDMLDSVLARSGCRERWRVELDFSGNAERLAQRLASENMNTPFWQRTLCVLEPAA